MNTNITFETFQRVSQRDKQLILQRSTFITEKPFGFNTVELWDFQGKFYIEVWKGVTTTYLPIKNNSQAINFWLDSITIK